MEWPRRARTADWENGVLTLDREKQLEVPELTAEIDLLCRLECSGRHFCGFFKKLSKKRKKVKK